MSISKCKGVKLETPFLNLRGYRLLKKIQILVSFGTSSVNLGRTTVAQLDKSLLL